MSRNEITRKLNDYSDDDFNEFFNSRYKIFPIDSNRRGKSKLGIPRNISRTGKMNLLFNLYGNDLDLLEKRIETFSSAKSWNLNIL